MQSNKPQKQHERKQTKLIKQQGSKQQIQTNLNKQHR